MMKSGYLFIALFFLWQMPSFACSCGGPSTFCETIESNFPPDLVIKGVKTADYHHGMRVRVLEILDGSHSADTVMVWGDNGALCRVYTSSFQVGDTLILGLDSTSQAGNFFSPTFPDSLEQVGDYDLSICGVYVLAVSNGQVHGPIKSGTDQVGYDDLDSAYVNGCMTTGIGSVAGSKDLKVVVSQGGGRLQIILPVSTSQKMNLRLVDLSGRELTFQSEFTGANSLEIIPRNYTPGIFFIQIAAGEMMWVGKIWMR